MFSSSSSSSLSSGSSSSSSSILELKSSSSSSSEFPNEWQKLMPFSYFIKNNNEITAITFGGEMAFASSADNDSVLSSSNRFKWESFFRIAGEQISCLFFSANFLYIGTSLSGKIIKVNIQTKDSKVSNSLNSGVKSIIEMNNVLYVFTEGGIYMAFETAKSLMLNNIYRFSSSCNSAKLLNNNIYISTNEENVLIFDGQNVKKHTMTSLSATNLLNINTKINRACALDAYRDGIVVGLSNKSEVLLIEKNTTTKLIDNGVGRIYDICSIDSDSFLFSDDNGLFLFYEEQIESSSDSDESSQTSNELTKDGIILTSPNSTNNYKHGDVVDIVWNNIQNSGPFKIILLNNGSKINTITSYTNAIDSSSETRTFQWIVPNDISGNKFQIKIETISGTQSGESSLFSIEYDNKSQNIAKTNNCIKLLSLDNEFITKIVIDDVYKNVVFGTSNGRILSADYIDIMAHATGNTKIYANVKSNYGNESNQAEIIVSHALNNYIATIDDSAIDWIHFAKKTTFLNNATVNGIFTSEIIDGGVDHGLWTGISWGQVKNSNDIRLYIRNAATIEDLYNSKWNIGFSESSITPNKNISNFGLNKRYVQVKIEIISSLANISGLVSHVTLSNFKKHSVSFFTTKFSTNSFKNGFLTANISKPINTEVEFGYTHGNSISWDNYKRILPDEYFETDGKDIKIGLKLISYKNLIPSVSEFAIIIDGEKKILQ